MADGIVLNAGAGGATLATDDAGAAGHVQVVKLAVSADGSATALQADNTNGLLTDVKRVQGNVTVVGPAADGAAVSGNPVRIAGSDGTNTQDISVTTSGHVQVHDGGNVLSVDDAGGSLTVDGTVAVSGTVTVDGSGVTQPVSHAALTELAAAINSSQLDVNLAASAATVPISHATLDSAHSADFDTGAGTDTTPAFGIAVPASGGAAVISGDTSNGLDVDVTRVSGNVTVVQSTATNLKVDASGVAVPVTDNGSSLTVDGTVAATQSGTWSVRLTDGTDTADVLDLTNSNPLTVAIVDGSGDQITSFGGGTQYTEDAAAAANPVGTALNLIRADSLAALTSADGDNVAARGTDKGELYVKHVDSVPVTDNGGSLTVDGTVTVSSISTSITPGTGAANLGKAEDSAHTTGDVGVMMLAVRQDSQSALAADGDYLPPTIDSAGGLRVSIVAGAGSGGTAQADDADFTATTTQGTPAMGVYESTPTNVTDGDLGIVGLTQKRHLKVTLFDTAGSEVSVGGGTQYDEDTAHVSGDKVTLAGVVRNDTRGALSGTDGDRTVLQVNASGDLRVDGSAVTQPVSHAGLTALNGAISGSEVQVDIVSAPTLTVDSELTTADLDTGAGTDTRAVVGLVGSASGGGQLIPGSATDGLLVNLGANNDVTVTGSVTANAGTNLNTSALALESGGNLATLAGAVRAEDAASADGHTGIPALAVRKATPANTSGADGDYEMLQMSAGRLWVDASGVTLTVGSHAVTNAGTFAVQVDGSALTALQLIDDPVIADDAAFTPATSKVMMAGFEADESSTDSVDEGDAGAARMTLDRKQIVTLQPHTAGGLAIFRSLDLDESEEDVKTSAGQVYSIIAMNRTATPGYLKLYNDTAANVTVGTTTPAVTIPIPANADSDVAGFVWNSDIGLAFGTAISAAVTTGVADSDTGAPGANDFVVQIFYK